MCLNLGKLLQFGKAGMAAMADMQMMIMLMGIMGKMLVIATQILAGALVALEMDYSQEVMAILEALAEKAEIMVIPTQAAEAAEVVTEAAAAVVVLPCIMDILAAALAALAHQA